MCTVVFDLDGTISDPAEGITKSINYALAKLGCATYPEENLLQYIGPPLQGSFSELTGSNDVTFLSRAVKFYRERYLATGYKENRLYDGIVDVLSTLVANGSFLCIATTKPKDVAATVLEFLGISQFFTQVHGCDIHRSKSDILQDILSDPYIGKRPIVMVGDRDSDFIAASQVNMPSIAVRWGYGKDEEFVLASKTVNTPDKLLDSIRNVAVIA